MSTTHRPVRARAILLSALVVLFVVASGGGCGIDAESQPRVIAQEELPPNLVNPDDGTSPPDPTGEERDVFFMTSTSNGDYRLVATPRKFEGEGPAAYVNALLTQPPDERERDEDKIITWIPADTILLNHELSNNGVLVLNLSEELLGVQGRELSNAFGQLVYTAMSSENDVVTSVAFQVDGEGIRARASDGVEHEQVTRGNYRSIRPR